LDSKGNPHISYHVCYWSDYTWTDGYLKYAKKRNYPPISNFMYTPESPDAYEPIIFTDTSGDRNRDIMNWTWDFDDGTISYLQNPTHQYSYEGMYHVILTVKDYHGQTASYTDQVSIGEGDNYPPDTPNIDGQTSGGVGEVYEYIVNTTDPNGDDVIYLIDWGEDSGVEEFGPYPHAVEIKFSHTWNEEGSYTIRAMAKDIYGAESDWAELEVSIPKIRIFSLYMLLQRLHENYPDLFALLTKLFVH
jgi:PKD repeat protein